MAMIRCSIENLKPGMVLGEPIHRDNGDILVQKGTRLTEKLIRHLQMREDITAFLKRIPETSAPAVDILTPDDPAMKEAKEYTLDLPEEEAEKDGESPAPEDGEPEEEKESEPEESAYRGSDPKKERLLDFNYLEGYKSVMEELRVLFNRNGATKLDLDAINELIASSRFKQLCNGARAVTQIHNIPREERNYLLHHSLHLAILGDLMGRWLGWPASRRRRLMVAGLLLDVGKLKIATALLNKPGVLSNTERAILGRHPAMACELLKFSGMDENDEVMIGIMQHHERCDGSGYPAQLKKNQISPFGHILGILDSYDAMAANRAYSRRKSPFDIFDIIQRDAVGGKFNPEYSVVFVSRICQALIGNWVKLSNGQKAKIVYIDQSRTSASAMPLVETEKGKFIDTGAQSVKVTELLTYVEAVS